MKTLAIKDICKKDSSSLKQKELLPEGKYPVYGASGIAGYLDSYHQDNEYIGIVKDGSGIGRVAFYPEKTSLIGTMQYILPKKGYNIRYIGYCLQSLDLSKYKQGAAIPHIYFRDYGERLVNVTESDEEQQAIVSRLDAAFAKIDALKANTEKQLNDARALFQAELSESMMPKEGWEEKVLKDIGVLKNGMNFNKNEFGYTVHILGVGDFGNQFQINDTDYLQTISLNSNPSEDYFLKNDDIVFVRSNGNKHLVGRCVLIHVGEEPCSFSGFCIRFRKLTNEVDSCFLTHFLKTDEARKKLVGNGANISNLNQKVLNEFVVSYPSIQEQQQIVAHLDALSAKVKELEKINEQTQKECDALKQAMLREIFE